VSERVFTSEQRKKERLYTDEQSTEKGETIENIVYIVKTAEHIIIFFMLYFVFLKLQIYSFMDI